MPAKLFLPNKTIKNMAQIFTVKAPNGREQTLVIPRTGDKGYDDYLKEAYTEKTINELMKTPGTYQEKKQVSQDEIKGALREYNEWRKKEK